MENRSVKVIASIPSDPYESGIEHIIGNVYHVVRPNPLDPSGHVWVNGPEFDGLIQLNPGEYEEVK